MVMDLYLIIVIDQCLFSFYLNCSAVVSSNVNLKCPRNLVVSAFYSGWYYKVIFRFSLTIIQPDRYLFWEVSNSQNTFFLHLLHSYSSLQKKPALFRLYFISPLAFNSHSSQIFVVTNLLFVSLVDIISWIKWINFRGSSPCPGPRS